MLDLSTRANNLGILYKSFLNQLPEMLKHHEEKFVVFGDLYPVEFYDVFERAANRGIKLYGLENSFLIQQVTKDPIKTFINPFLVH